jgi:hypothetical protein
MDIHDKVTTIMYQLFNNQSLFEILKSYSKDSNLVLSIDMTDNTESVCVNVFKKMRKSEFIKTQLPKYRKIKTVDCNDSCSICLDKYTENTYKRTLDCSHHFHKKCIDKWFMNCDEENIHCPICRKHYVLTLNKISDLQIDSLTN